MTRFLLMFMIFAGCCMASEKSYIDCDDLDASKSQFHIHTGHNNWVKTAAIYSDGKGIYTYDDDIVREDLTAGYKQQWKCPYCFTYYDIGQACTNADCPSKYKP